MITLNWVFIMMVLLFVCQQIRKTRMLANLLTCSFSPDNDRAYGLAAEVDATTLESATRGGGQLLQKLKCWQ